MNYSNPNEVKVNPFDPHTSQNYIHWPTMSISHISHLWSTTYWKNPFGNFNFIEYTYTLQNSTLIELDWTTIEVKASKLEYYNWQKHFEFFHINSLKPQLCPLGNFGINWKSVSNQEYSQHIKTQLRWEVTNFRVLPAHHSLNIESPFAAPNKVAQAEQKSCNVELFAT